MLSFVCIRHYMILWYVSTAAELAEKDQRSETIGYKTTAPHQLCQLLVLLSAGIERKFKRQLTSQCHGKLSLYIAI